MRSDPAYATLPSDPPSPSMAPQHASEGCCSSCWAALLSVFHREQDAGQERPRGPEATPTLYHSPGGYQAPTFTAVAPPAVAMSNTDSRASEKNRLLPNRLESSTLVAHSRRDDTTNEDGGSAEHSGGGDGPTCSSSGPQPPEPCKGAVHSASPAAGHRRTTSLGQSDKGAPGHRRTISQSSQEKERDGHARPGHRRTGSKTKAMRMSSGGSAVVVDQISQPLSFNTPAKPLVPQDEDDDFCPTCLEVYTTENPKIWTECGHHFHMPCIYEWMERKDTCPICESKMTFPGQG